MTTSWVTHEMPRPSHGKLVRVQGLFCAGLYDEALFRDGKDPQIAILHRAVLAPGALRIGYPLTREQILQLQVQTVVNLGMSTRN